jgi:peptidoglycan/xylan/chitin deacetylase (PgdA/CDA1 family)
VLAEGSGFSAEVDFVTRRALVFRLIRFSLIPFALRQTIQRRRVTIVVYHDPDPGTFERHLALLRRLYNIVRLADAVRALSEGSLRSLPPKALAVTLDDGHRRNFQLKPVLEKLDVPVTIFVCTGIVGTRRGFWFKHVELPTPLKTLSDEERVRQLLALGFDEEEELAVRDALSREEMLEMRGPLVDFESHTVSHPILPYCSDAKTRAEICHSRDDLIRSRASRGYALSYPNGVYSDREIRFAKECGYACALTTDGGYNSHRTDLFRLRRLGIYDRASLDEVVVETSGLWRAIRRRKPRYMGAS